MHLAKLTEYLIKSIVKNPDMVTVKKFDGDEDIITIQVLVDDSDMGSVIGKNGNVANAIRTIIIDNIFNKQQHFWFLFPQQIVTCGSILYIIPF